MAHHNSPPNSRHVMPNRRAQKRGARAEILRRELELREHPPAASPAHPPRLQTRNRAPLWKLVRRAAGVLMLLGLIELGAASLTARPFKVISLDVVGCELTDENAVLDLASPLVGQNWIRAATRNVEAQIEAIPTVREARVSRVLDWPPRLHVNVIEREAFARVGAAGDWWVVDESGVAFRRANESDQDLYAVTSPKLIAHLGSALPESAWRPVVEFADALKHEGEQDWSLRRIYFDKDGSASLRLAGGFHDETLVRLGSDHWNEKLVRARQALSYFEQTKRRAAVLNLVSYETPQWTPRTLAHSSTGEANSHVIGQAADTHSET